TGPGGQSFEGLTEFELRPIAEVAPTGREQIERHERSGRLLRQLRDPRGGRVEPHLQRVEIKSASTRDHDFAVDDAARWKRSSKRLVQLRKIPIERTQVPALDEHLVVGTPKDDGAETV